MAATFYDCIIIGAGVGGLTAGAFLAQSGKKTILFEKNDIIGGMATTFSFDGYTFDAGGTPQQDQIKMLQELGVADMVEFIPMGNPAIGMYFPGATFFGPKPIFEFIDQFKPFCSHQELNQLADILSTFERLDMEKYTQLNRTMSESKLRFLARLLRINPFELLKVLTLMTSSMDAWLKKRIDNETAIQILEFISALTLLFPCQRMPALLGVLIMSGFTGKLGGRWHLIKGGNINYSRALAAAMTRAGGRIETGAPVSSILIRDGCASGVILQDGRQIHARHIISNIGIKETMHVLVGDKYLEHVYIKKIDSLLPSPSMFKLCLGLNKKPDIPAPVNFKVSELDQEAWWASIEQGMMPDKPPLMFWCKYLVDASLAPPGKYDLDIVVAAPYRHRDGDWSKVKYAVRDKVIAVMREIIPDIDKAIEFEWMMTPPDLEALSGQHGGGILPIEPSVGQLMRFPDMETPIRQLYCVGATVKGGAGINGAAATGRLCAKRIAAL
ncbi:MAG: NAD(P)/FAD-dependent oxidoreductase [Desulfobacterota bacterium]|nr:NAD(P)/FAD-dependent oxidoreductase [Thermodesulfobacteriota bacterium]